MKTFYICVVVLSLSLTGCASTPYKGGYDDGGAALMNYGAQMMQPYGGGGFGGYGYAQPARMQTTCIQQGPWLQCN